LNDAEPAASALTLPLQTGWGKQLITENQKPKPVPLFNSVSVCVCLTSNRCFL
jgi:hypothetical protein